MALTATIRKAELQISDLDRGYYATHNLTLAQHPSETDERLMVRLLAFALFARERLEFGRGLSESDEPDLSQHDYTGDIALWIDLGLPDESRVRKACNRATEVIVVNYSGNTSELWWKKQAAALARFGNLRVIDIDPATVEALARRIQRGMRFQVLIQDGEVQWFGDDGETLAFIPGVRKAAST
ncbi:MAG: YaeQ family protein [Pseudomonas sp.]